MSSIKFAIWVDEEDAEIAEEALDAAEIMRYQTEHG